MLDRDKVVGFDRIIEDTAKEGISVGWSNPCIEIWFSAYFGDMRMCETSVGCNEHFSSLFRKRTGIEYNKADKRNYEHLCDMRMSMGLSRLPSEDCLTTCSRMEGYHLQGCSPILRFIISSWRYP